MVRQLADLRLLAFKFWRKFFVDHGKDGHVRANASFLATRWMACSRGGTLQSSTNPSVQLLQAVFHQRLYDGYDDDDDERSLQRAAHDETTSGVACQALCTQCTETRPLPCQRISAVHPARPGGSALVGASIPTSYIHSPRCGAHTCQTSGYLWYRNQQPPADAPPCLQGRYAEKNKYPKLPNFSCPSSVVPNPICVDSLIIRISGHLYNTQTHITFSCYPGFQETPRCT